MEQKEYAIRPNKSQIKREIKEFTTLAKALLNLPASALQKFPLNAETLEALIQAKGFSRAALQRQLKRITKLMQQEDRDAIELALAKIQHSAKQDTNRFHQLEVFRERLLQGDNSVLSELRELAPNVDTQYIRQLTRNASKEQNAQKNIKYKRQLFQYLRQITETA